MTKSSVLSQSGLNSLSQKDLDVSPYFPHKYRDFDHEYPNKWSGRREWKDECSQSIQLPSVEKEYFPKWS